jgi:hypothetical protein
LAVEIVIRRKKMEMNYFKKTVEQTAGFAGE